MTVDRSLTYPQMIKAGSYENYHDAVEMVTEDRFPVDRTGALREDKELFLVPPSHSGMATTEWMTELEADGWVLEQAPELFAFGAKYPDLLEERCVIAFGSSLRDPDGSVSSLVLSCEGGKCLAFVEWNDADEVHLPHDRALVSRKVA